MKAWVCAHCLKILARPIREQDSTLMLRLPRALWRERDWRIRGSVQARWIGDSRWTPAMYDLVLTGNAGHLGRWDVLDGSRARTAAWLNAAVGIEGKHQNRVELGLVYRPFQFEGFIETGYFHVKWHNFKHV